MNLRFYSKTQWQMFLLVSGRHMLVPVRMGTNMASILGEVAYIAIIYHILDSWINLLNDYDF